MTPTTTKGSSDTDAALAAAKSVFERNLAALADRNGDVVAELRAAARAAVEWIAVPDGTQPMLHVPVYEGRALASRHAPREEATNFADAIDLRDKAVVAVLGFGAGFHVAELCARLGRTGLVVVVEPDLALLRAVLERTDWSAALSQANVLLFTGLEQLGRFAERFAGAEGVLVQGVQVVEHPASRARLAPVAKDFAQHLTETVRAARVTAATGLARSAHTIRSILRNARLYIGGEGIAPLEGIARGRLGIVVSAGPSLRRNLHLLARPGVRERCVIVATQTVLKPLLAEGIRPHFVAALDWHQISRRFYEGLRERDVADTTLILDPQANPVIAESYPGPVRSISAPHLDTLLGPLAREHGRLPAGATVAHLCYQIARFLGCDPVALIGQDLGFTDGVYYARGTAIDDVWAPELNPFNTIENLEWTRIVRHRTHLVKRRDVHGKSIYTDAQMETYLQRFEYFFLQDERRGLRTIDATEGGVRKAGTEVKALAETLASHACEQIAAIPLPQRALDAARLGAAAQRLRAVLADVRVIHEASRRTGNAIAQLAGASPRTADDDRLWRTVDAERAKVGERLDTLRLLDDFSQVGLLKRAKADRRIVQSRGILAEERQRLQFERDLANVRWIEESSSEYASLLESTVRRLEGDEADGRTDDGPDEAAVSASADGALSRALGESSAPSEVRAAFMVPIDPWHGGLGTPRSLAEPLAGKTAVQWTLERLARSREASSIILIAPEGFDLDSIIDRRAITLPLEVHRTKGSPFGPERAAIATARLWSDSSWRGGIANATVYDEVVAPRQMYEAMVRFGVTAAVVVGPEWPLVTVTGADGCDALVRRHRTRPELLRIGPARIDRLAAVLRADAPAAGPDLEGCLRPDRPRGEAVAGACGLRHAAQHDPHAPRHRAWSRRAERRRGGDRSARGDRAARAPAVRHGSVLHAAAPDGRAQHRSAGLGRVEPASHGIRAVGGDDRTPLREARRAGGGEPRLRDHAVRRWRPSAPSRRGALRAHGEGRRGARRACPHGAARPTGDDRRGDRGGRRRAERGARCRRSRDLPSHAWSRPVPRCTGEHRACARFACTSRGQRRRSLRHALDRAAAPAPRGELRG
ncbi:MAG: hypothetical protein RL354_488, partial [Planctomycetota bacterium]